MLEGSNNHKKLHLVEFKLGSQRTEQREQGAATNGEPLPSAEHRSPPAVPGSSSSPWAGGRHLQPATTAPPSSALLSPRS